MSQGTPKLDYSLVHPAPGHGKPLAWTPEQTDELYVGAPLPTALLADSITSGMFSNNANVAKAFLPIVTVRELLMLRFMNLVTDKPDWQKKVFDDEIVAKWRGETVPPNTVNEAVMTDAMFDFCVEELKHKAEHVYSDPNTPIVVYNGNVVKSDTAVPESVKYALQDAVKVLEDVPAHQKDWHPGSNDMVLDLVHPSLFPLIYGKSRVLKVGQPVVGIDDCIARCGEGEVLELAEEKDKPIPQGRMRYSGRRVDMDPYSAKFQWLPCEVDISGDGGKIISYINNLHPKYTELYRLMEKVIDASIPLWERTLAPLRGAGEPCLPLEYIYFFQRIACSDVEYLEEEENEEEEEDDEEEEEEWRERKVLQPEPKPFDAEKFYIQKPLNLKELYAQQGRPLQVIVKLANIELTPEKPKYDGGSWHVEGKQNEHICATAIYYYSSSNTKSSHLGFKQFVETDSISEFGYEQSDHGFLREYFGCRNEEPGVQYVGNIETKEGRLLTFPNILQHRVQPFELEDPTKPGHRKIVALFLVDPNVRVVSTAHVPAQQVDWWRESSAMGKGTKASAQDIATGLDKLPVELKDKVFEEIEEFPITLREAKELRGVLIEERKYFIQEHEKAVQLYNAFSLCEH